MKTSNKLLLGLCFTFWSCILVGIVVAKSNMNVYRVGDDIELTYQESKTLLESYDSNILNLYGEDFRRFTLDPDQTSVIVKGDKRNVVEVSVMDDKGLYFYRKGDERVYANLSVTIGTKGKEDLVLNIKKFSKVKNIGQLTGKIRVEIKNDSELELNFQGNNLTINGKDDSLISLRGSSRVLSIVTEDDCAFYGQEFFADTLEVDLIEDALVKLQGSKFVTGEVEDEAALLFSQSTNIGMVRKRGQGRVAVE